MRRTTFARSVYHVGCAASVLAVVQLPHIGRRTDGDEALWYTEGARHPPGPAATWSHIRPICMIPRPSRRASTPVSCAVSGRARCAKRDGRAAPDTTPKRNVQFHRNSAVRCSLRCRRQCACVLRMSASVTRPTSTAASSVPDILRSYWPGSLPSSCGSTVVPGNRLGSTSATWRSSGRSSDIWAGYPRTSVRPLGSTRARAALHRRSARARRPGRRERRRPSPRTGGPPADRPKPPGPGPATTAADRPSRLLGPRTRRSAGRWRHRPRRRRSVGGAVRCVGFP